jgi:hypothetical protein
MLDRCANPQCAKPLRYLREGRIFVFDSLPSNSNSGPGHKLEHFWLCGECSQTMVLAKTRTGVKVEIKAVQTSYVHVDQARAS